MGPDAANPRAKVKDVKSFIFGICDHDNANKSNTSRFYELKTKQDPNTKKTMKISAMVKPKNQEAMKAIQLEYKCCDLHTEYECYCIPPYKLRKDGGHCADEEELERLKEIWYSESPNQLLPLSESKMVSVFKYIPDCVLGEEDKEEEFKIIEVRTDRIAVFSA